MMLNEENMIRKLRNTFPDYIGDDAAVLPIQKNHYIITKDILIENIHFRTRYFSPQDLAHKALQVNLSDLAAMGAEPAFILCGIAIPLEYDKYSQDFLESLSLLSKKNNIILIGGDTVRSPDILSISITAIGHIDKKNIKYRHSAQIHDVICVAGDLGYAHLGFLAVEQSLCNFEKYKKAFLKPNAKIQEGLWLGAHDSITSMMDLSDGLLVDLQRLAASSKIQANIKLEHLKPSNDFIRHCDILEENPIHTMIAGAEDYGLLFTVNSNNYTQLSSDFEEHFKYSIQYIGHITQGSGVYFTENNIHKKLNLNLFSHFGEKNAI